VSSLIVHLLLLANVGVSGSVRMEAQAGEAPTPADPNPSAYTAALLRPDVTLSLLSPATETRFSEAPRLFLRRPNSTGRNRPLYLNMLQAEHRGQHGQRLHWEIQLVTIAGEMDYAALSQTLGRQAALPDTLDLLTADGVGTMAWRLSRRLEWSNQFGVLRRQPLWASEPAPGPGTGLGLPTETDERFESRLQYAMSRRQTGQVGLKLANYRLTGAVALSAMAAEWRVGWQYQLSRRQDLRLAAGVAVATALERADASRPWTALAPLAEVGWTLAEPLSRTSTLRGGASGEVLWYLDPVLGVALPRGQIVANLAIELGQAWLIDFNLQAATNLSRQPLVGSPIETFVSAGAPVRYRVQRHLLVEFGGRYSERGPHLATPGFSLRQREMLGYLALTATTR
jgi:hypothetical protein